VIGEEGTSIEDFTLMLKAEFFDSSYLQQNAFDKIDGATPSERQRYVFDKAMEVLNLDFEFEDKAEARRVMVKIGSLFLEWNYAPWDPSVLHQEKDAGFENVVPDAAARDIKTGESAAKVGPKVKPDDPPGDADRGNFSRILERIDEFIQNRGRMAIKKNEKQPPGSRMLKRMKDVRTEARPKSMRTRSGRESDAEEDRDFSKDE